MVSLANRQPLDLLFCGRLLMYARKSSGSMTEPWGTPERTATKSDLLPSTTMYCCWFSRKTLIHFSVASNTYSPVYKEVCCEQPYQRPYCFVANLTYYTCSKWWKFNNCPASNNGGKCGRAVNTSNSGSGGVSMVLVIYCWGVTLLWTSNPVQGGVAILLGLLHAMKSGTSTGRLGLWFVRAFTLYPSLTSAHSQGPKI